MRIAAATALSLLYTAPAPACSGVPARLHQYQADVIVAGRVTRAPGSAQEAVAVRRVLKGPKHISYPIVWPAVSMEDECAFVYAATLDRGVFFLKRRDDGRYDVLWTEKRWKMVR